jgi:hypothetical protein
MKSPILTEADLASKVVSWLESDGWEVFQEVQPEGWGGPRADIVAVQEGRVWVVECKKQFSFDLLAQAEKWKPYSNRASIAVPYARRSDGRSTAFRVAGLLGLGVFEVESLWPVDADRIPAVKQVVEPEYRGFVDWKLRDALRPEHKEYAKAGESGLVRRDNPFV